MSSILKQTDLKSIWKVVLNNRLDFKKIWQRSYLTLTSNRGKTNNNKEKLQRENRKKEAKTNTAALKAEARVPFLAIIYPNIYVEIIIKILQSIFTEIQPGIIPKFRLYWTLKLIAPCERTKLLKGDLLGGYPPWDFVREIKSQNQNTIKKLNGLIKSIDTHKLLKFLWKYFDSYKSWLFWGVYIRAKYCRRH